VLSVGGVWLGQSHEVNVLCDRSLEYGGWRKADSAGVGKAAAMKFGV
jgi:hypothetical protein